MPDKEKKAILEINHLTKDFLSKKMCVHVVADPNVEMDRIPLAGEIPNPANPPSGCYFHTRCRYCKEKCKEAMPEYREVEPGHYVACHFADELNLRGFSYEEAQSAVKE